MAWKCSFFRFGFWHPSWHPSWIDFGSIFGPKIAPKSIQKGIEKPMLKRSALEGEQKSRKGVPQGRTARSGRGIPGPRWPWEGGRGKVNFPPASKIQKIPKSKNPKSSMLGFSPRPGQKPGEFKVDVYAKTLSACVHSCSCNTKIVQLASSFGKK